MFRQGYVPVPLVFLRRYTDLKPYPLTLGEAMFVVHLMQYKWDAAEPFPSYKTIAGQMGISDKQARRLAKSLEEKGYLRRIQRTGRSNLFDLTPLFDAVYVLDQHDRGQGEA